MTTYCLFCQTSGHDVVDCPNIDPEQLAIELVHREHKRQDPHCTCNDCLADLDTPTVRIRQRPQTYGIFWKEGDMQMWARCSNKRNALRFGKIKQALVTGMLAYGSRGAWDAPTFKACSDRVADFR